MSKTKIKIMLMVKEIQKILYLIENNDEYEIMEAVLLKIKENLSGEYYKIIRTTPILQEIERSNDKKNSEENSEKIFNHHQEIIEDGVWSANKYISEIKFTNLLEEFSNIDDDISEDDEISEDKKISENI